MYAMVKQIQGTSLAKAFSLGRVLLVVTCGSSNTWTHDLVNKRGSLVIRVALP